MSFEIRLLGGFEVRVDGLPLPRLRYRTGEWALALLALRQGRSVERAWLAAMLWPDSDESNGLFYLRRCLTDLRHALGSEANRLLSPTPRTLRLDLEGAWCDLLQYDRDITSPEAATLEAATNLYRGALLEGCRAEWAIPERQAREQTFLNALEALAARTAAADDHAAAIGYLRRVISIEPTRESAQRSLLQALAAHGDYAAVTEAYRAFRLYLHQELHCQPDIEIQALYERLRTERIEATLRSSPASTASAQEPTQRGRLPKRLTSLIGREHELEEVTFLLRRAALVTLTGSGGIGKTRLAIALAEKLQGEFSAGAWFIDLAPVTEAEGVGQAVASALEVRDEPRRPLLQTLQEALIGKTRLLILDNCEHLIQPCALLADALLQACPGLKILATSRQPLGIHGEQTWRVPSLSLPEDLQPADKGMASQLRESEAVRLFVERAHSVSPDWRPSPEDLLTAAQICRRLDGIAFAIELAAARTRTLSLPEIHARLDDRFRLLTGGNRAALPRHQTLRALIDWSYNLLDASERILLRRLSVFRGGWRLEAAEAVCPVEDVQTDTQDADAVLNLLTSLVDKSLVLVERHRSGMRFRLLETLREYALKHLVASGEEQTTHYRHFQWFLQRAEEADKHLNGQDQALWLERLDAERDNLRAALHWGLHTAAGEGEERSSSGKGESEILETLRLATALTTFWSMRGNYTEGRAALQEALMQADAVASPQDYADGLNDVGLLATNQGDYAAAKTALESCLAMRRDLGNRRGVSGTLHNLGNIAYYQGDLTQARHLWKEALSINRELGNRSWEANNLGCLGNAAYTGGDYAAARALWEEARDLFRILCNRAEEARILNNLGHAYVAQGEATGARTLWEEALAITRELGDRDGEAYSLGNLAELACERGEYAAAQSLEEQSLQIHREVGNHRDEAGNLAHLGRLARERGEYAQAYLLFEQALTMNREIGNRTWEAGNLVGLGEIACLLDDPSGATALGREALLLMNHLGMKGEIPEALELLALTWATQGDGQRAVRLRAAAATLREAVGKPEPPGRGAGLEDAMTTAHTPLDPEAFQREWNIGHALTLDQAIELAIAMPAER